MNNITYTQWTKINKTFFYSFTPRYIRVGEKECEYNSSFRLVLHTKLANPHFPPELQAQTTLINFTVTPVGLEEQLLGQVVFYERPELEASKVNCIFFSINI